MYAIGITYLSPQHSPQHINVFYDVNSMSNNITFSSDSLVSHQPY